MNNRIDISKKAEKGLKKCPKHIVENFRIWTMIVETTGIESARQVKGYHDEPLQGNHKGQRSIRLSRSYRAIYEEHPTGEITIIYVTEVNKHEY